MKERKMKIECLSPEQIGNLKTEECELFYNVKNNKLSVKTDLR